MKIEEGKILINNKISDLENIVKEELRDTKIDYFKKQILPKTISALTIIFGETKILTSGFSSDEKSALQMLFAFYCFTIILINAFFHEDYYFLSSNKDTLERVKLYGLIQFGVERTSTSSKTTPRPRLSVASNAI